MTNGIGWGGTLRGGARRRFSAITLKDKKINKTMVFNKLIVFWGLSIVLSIAPYQAFTESLLDRKSYQCIKKLWYKESRWNPKSVSPTHDYGIPQRHMKTASKQAIAEFMENPYTQILWGLGYVEHRYGSACKAWAHSQRKGWY